MLTQRQKDILQLIIQNYTKNNQPVGSKKLMNDGIDASSATIRNEMKSLEEHGLLAKPHSSSGRIPFDCWLSLLCRLFIKTYDCR